MVKFIGCVLIFLSCSGIGYMLGVRFKSRVRELKLLRMSIQMLETEIVYANTPLPDAFSTVSKKSLAPVKEVFKSVSEALGKKRHFSVSEAYESAILEIKGRLSLNKEDMELLSSFCSSLGNSDMEGQVKNFKMILKQLENQEERAEEARGKSERMYKNLGVLAGLAIAIILL